MVNTDSLDLSKARRLVDAGDEAADALRALRARHLDARAEAFLLASRVTGRHAELQAIPLGDMLKWSDDDLYRASTSRGEVRAAVEAQEHATAIGVRLRAADAAAAGPMRLGAKVREYVALYGVIL